MGGGGNGNRGTGMGRNNPDSETVDGSPDPVDGFPNPVSRLEFEFATAAASFREMVSDMFRESAAITASASMGRKRLRGCRWSALLFMLLLLLMLLLVILAPATLAASNSLLFLFVPLLVPVDGNSVAATFLMTSHRCKRVKHFVLPE